MRRSHHVPKRWLVKRRLLVRGYHVYKDIWAAAIREVLVCSTEPTNVGTIFVVKLYSRKIFSYVFCVATKIFLRRIAFYALCLISPTYVCDMYT